MSLTPRRNPIPLLNQTQGITGTFPAGDSVTVKDGAVQAVTPASNSTSNNTGLQANAPLNLAGNTLAMAPATDSANGYMSAVDHATLTHLATWGTIADRPVTPQVPDGTMAFYFATDVPALFAWAGAWYCVSLCPTSSSSSSPSSSSM